MTVSRERKRKRVASPINPVGPSEADVVRTNYLEKFLKDSRLYESAEEAAKREDVVSRLREIVKDIICQNGMAEDVYALMDIFGSYCLGVHGPGADIDTLCIGPPYVTRKDFFRELHTIFASTEGVTEVRSVQGYSRVMKFKLDGIPIDLVYANVTLSAAPIDHSKGALSDLRIQDLDISDDSLLHNVDKDNSWSLRGLRDTEKILKLIPNVEHFRTALRCVRFWAKRRCVYSNMIGFLGGVHWALLLGRICQLHPNANPSMLVSHFFRVYAQWGWSNPIMLCDIEDKKLGFDVWDPSKIPRKRKHLMQIITPAYPCKNSSENVFDSTQMIMKGQFKFGDKICKEIGMDKRQWSALFEPFKFFERYKNYLQVDILAADADYLLIWKDWVYQKLGKLALKLERTFRILCHPYPYECVDSSNQGPHCAFFLGFKIKPRKGTQKGLNLQADILPKTKSGEGTQEGPQLDIFSKAEEFWSERKKNCKFWKEGMEISVKSVPWEEIPAYVLQCFQMHMDIVDLQDFESNNQPIIQNMVE